MVAAPLPLLRAPDPVGGALMDTASFVIGVIVGVVVASLVIAFALILVTGGSDR